MVQSDRKPEMKIISGGNQMSLIRDTEEVVKFLDFTANKNIMDEHAVQCRLTACHNLFSVVTEEEDSVDYMLSNLEVFINRFRNKNKVSNEATLRVYKSRVKSSLEDYKAWSADPFVWERSLAEKNKAKDAEAKKEKKVTKRAPKEAKQKEVKSVEVEPVKVEVESVTAHHETPQVVTLSASASLPTGTRRLSLPLRGNQSFEVTLPEDGLTWKEFQRIGIFLYAYCRDVDFAEFGWGNLNPRGLQ